MAHRHVSARGEGTTAVLSPGDRERGSAFVTKGSRPLSRRYGGVDATERGRRRGCSDAPRGLRSPLVEASSRDWRGRLTPARSAHRPMVAGPSRRAVLRVLRQPTWRGTVWAL
jgi:hypothetical protein